MDPKIEVDHRLNISNDIGSSSKTKGKDKARKELWDSLLAVYENENGKRVKGRQQQEEADHFTNLTRHTRYGLKLKRKSKPKHVKKTVVNENDDIEHKTAHEKDKDRHKFKDLERHKKSLNTTVPEVSLKDQDENVPSVIILHKYKKEVFNKQTEPYAEGLNPLGKPNHKSEKNRKKTKVEHKTDSQEHVVINNKSPCNNTKSSFKIGDGDKLSPSNKDQSKNKIRKRQEKGVVGYKTLSTCLEPKLRKRRKKLDRQEMLKEVIATLKTNKDIYEKIKSLPIKLDENQLIFMHPSHITKALELGKDNKINKREKLNNSDSMSNELNESISYDMKKKKVCTKTSSNKLVLDNRASSKRLRVLSSLKKIRKSIPVVLEEKSDISLIKVLKNKKEPRKRRIKLSSDKKKSIQELSNTGKEPKESQKLKVLNNLTQSENYSKQNFSILRQNVCFGDNTVNTSNGQNDKLFTSLSDSVRFKPKLNQLDFDNKNDSAIQKSSKFHDTEYKLRKNNKKQVKKLRKVIHNNYDNSGDQIKPAVSDEEKKLTFQLIKTDRNPENLKRLRKNLYSVSDRRTLVANKEKISPTIQNDKLYVTKRMLFFTNKESSSTSKESLNIAIRRDTEISNNGSSNNILNVVIKQKKNSVSSTKSANSPKLDNVGSQYINNHCITKSLQEMSNENDLETICKEEVESMIKNKQLKEAECQTEENTPIVNESNEKNGNKVPLQSFQPGNGAIKDEFHNFLMYHFKNFNPSFRKSNATNKSHVDEMLNKKEIQKKKSTDKFEDHSKFVANDHSMFTRNMNISTPENQTFKIRVSGSVQKVDKETNSTKKPFYRVLSRDEYDLEKLKSDEILGVRKINTPDDNKLKSGINKEIPKSNLRIIEGLCQKNETENIAKKLKSIGLSDKRSFVKVINSNYKLENSVSNVVDFCKQSLPSTSAKSAQKEKSSTTKHVTVQMKDDLKTIINKRQQNQKFSADDNIYLTKHSRTGKVISSSPKIQRIKKKENYLLENNNINTADMHKLNATNICALENMTTNNYELATEDNIKLYKQNFVSILSEHGDTKKISDAVTVEKPQNKLNVQKKISCCVKRNFVVSEIGIQTETSDFLPTVPYKNTPGLKINDNSNFDSTKKLNLKETAVLMEKPQLLSNKTKYDGLVHTDRVGIPLQEKCSFVHIISNKSDTYAHMNNNGTLIENKAQISFPVNFSQHKGVKKVSIRKSCEEKQVIDKINAVYEFLQYLDTILKENSFLKHSNAKDTHAIGHFNNTLRCLCDNCVEILNKIEVKESVNRNKILEVKKSLENSLSQNEKSHFRKIICEPKTENNQKENNLLNVQYVNPKEFEMNSFMVSDIELNKNPTNPFFVVISPDEKPQNKTDDGLENPHTKSKQYVKVGNNKPGSDRNKTYSDSKNNSEEALSKQKVNNCTAMEKKEQIKDKVINNTKKLPINDIIHNAISVNGNKILDEQILQTRIFPQDNSGNILQVSQSSEIDDNPCSKWYPHNVSKPLFNHVKNFSTKSELESYDCGNSTGLTKQQDCNLNTNLFCKPSDTLSKMIPVNNHGLNKKLTSSCCKSNNFNTLDKKNILPADCKNKLLPTSQITKGDNFKLCKNCSNSKQKCCCSQSFTRLWMHKMKSPFKSPFKKDDKTAKIKFSHLQSDLSRVNIMKTCETKPSENKILKELQIEKKLNPEIKTSCITHSKNKVNIKNNLNPLSFGGENEDYSGKKCNVNSEIYFNQQYFERKKSDIISFEESRHQRNVKNFKGFDANVTVEQKMKASTSVEYVNVTGKNNNNCEQILEDKDVDSDGWIPLIPTNNTGIENNEICFGMNMKDMRVNHIEYVQKFPNNLSHCGQFGKK